MVKYYFFTSSYGGRDLQSKKGYNLRDSPETRKKPALQASPETKNRYRSENTLYLLFIFILLSVPDFLKFSCLISDPSADH